MRIYSGGSEEHIKYSGHSHDAVPTALFGQLTALLLPAWWHPQMWPRCQGWSSPQPVLSSRVPQAWSRSPGSQLGEVMSQRVSIAAEE